MGESIFMRVRRVVSGSVEDSVDRLEIAGGDSVMREAIREVDRLIDQLSAEQSNIAARRMQAVRQQRLLGERAHELERKAAFAVSQDRDDLAEAALTRQLDFERQRDALCPVQEQCVEAEAKLEERLGQLRGRKAQMEEALAAFMAAQLDADAAGVGQPRFADAERRAEQAEQAFDRAMKGAGGIGFQRVDAAASGGMAELDALEKTATVAERLAALKGGRTGGSHL